MAEFTKEQADKFPGLLVGYAVQWHKAHMAYGTPEFDEEFKKEQDEAKKLINFIVEL